ncbi:unnamed protein product [Rotaria magnacalcarata]|uniref:Uncharacterized protein n=1 Tax=Rotaria magnacalcarata TaxID=392030 RepID=A0A819C9L4_9BILA|nr:unnamed protein product [Rotaria magnacalcarata]CAF2122345.1 unnamed protein product [Rotaria magnacalcarata]CAF3817096.1 unnamed protein product [Rotaria magnacalcarata]CAF3959502.1 unnamed protein product [Rotaria magnacalcarata]
MFIRLFFIYIHILVSQILASCPYIRTSVILAECIFDTNLYISFGANILNSNSIDFVGHYSTGQHNNINNTLIYNLGNRWMLLVPLLIKCSHQSVNLTFTECQYTMRHNNKYPNRLPSSPEYMTTQLSVINITDLDQRSVLFLQPGEISLRSCKAYDCSREIVYLTASNETFNFKINYEKPINTKCQYDEDCQNSYSIKNLIYCNKLSKTCQCHNENISNMDIAGVGRFCTDSIDQSNCTKFPRRCLQWCDKSETSHCVCPKSTRKVRKINGVFDCELEPTGICRFDYHDSPTIGSNIRKCPTGNNSNEKKIRLDFILGTYCDGNQCRPLAIFRQTHEKLFSEIPVSSTTTVTSTFSLLSSTYKNLDSDDQTAAFIRTLIFIAIAIILFFVLIIIIITILIKSRRLRTSSSSLEDKVSSSSFAPSTSTTTSTDSPTHHDYHHQLKQQNIATITSSYCENYLPKSPFAHGLVPQTNLSPRFHRQQKTIDDRRRIPLNIRSPSLSRINPFIDHAALTTNEHITKKRSPLPKITRLQNGDVLITA